VLLRATGKVQTNDVRGHSTARPSARIANLAFNIPLQLN
jgi:hypothetical protein